MIVRHVDKVLLAGTWALWGLLAIAPTTGFSQTQPFSDVATTDPDYNATLTLYKNDITHGCASSPLQYCPSTDITRDEMAAFIVRAWSIRIWGEPEAFMTYEPPSTTPYFTDVSGDLFFNYIQKLYELNITTGCAAGLFCPTSPLQNFEAAVFIARARALSDNDCWVATTSGTCSANNFTWSTSAPYFTDVPSTDTYFKYIQRLGDLNAYNGVYSPTPTLGCGSCVFDEPGYITRGNMAIELLLGTGVPLKYGTEISISTSLAATAGTSVTITATVTRIGGTGYPTGEVIISEQVPYPNTYIQHLVDVPLSSGAASTTFTIAAAGDWLVASYSGEPDNCCDWGSVAQITTLGGSSSQTITFGSLSNVPLGTNSFNLSATASSGLTVGFASTTPLVCTVSGVSVTVEGAGSCSITASQNGDAIYAAATPVTQSFTVTKVGQTITFGPIGTQSIGSGTLSVSATATSGLPVAFSSTTLSYCTVSGTTVTFAAAGTCSIEADQSGNTNYNAASPVTQSFIITSLATQTISFSTPGVQTVGVPLTLSASAVPSGLTVSYSSNTTSVCTVSGSTLSLVSAGTCSITANQSGNGTYAAATAVTVSFPVDAACTTTLREYIRLGNRAVAIENSCAIP